MNNDPAIVSLIDTITPYNKIAIGCIILAKLCCFGTVGLILAGIFLPGYICLGLYALFLIIAVALCLIEMKRQNEDKKPVVSKKIIDTLINMNSKEEMLKYIENNMELK